jgi:cysteine desulfurase family protein (TIGR01976 family)
MISLDVDFARSHFPAFAEPSLARFAHFENAGGSYACRQVVAALDEYYRRTKVQPYYAFEPSAVAGARMDSARRRLAEWLNAEVDEVHLGPSTSQNTYVLAQAFRRWLRPGDEIVVTNQDHEANVGAWARLQDEGFTVRTWKVDAAGALHARDLGALLSARTRVVAFTHCSNVVGQINPVREFTDLVHQAGAWAVVDGVSYAPHGLPDMAELGADIYLFSLYKVYGPHLGATYVRRDLAAQLPSQAHFFKSHELAGRFTPAGPDHAQVAAVNGVIDYMEALAAHHGHAGATVRQQAAAVRMLMREQEIRLLEPLLEFMSRQPRIRVIGPVDARTRAPTVGFTIDGLSSQDVGAALARLGIGVGAGNFYAYRLLQALGIDTADGVVRASFVHYTSPAEIERLIAALATLLR